MKRWPSIFRCFLVLALWQGPLPVMHSHGTLAHASVDTELWLSEHLTSDHADIAPAADIVFGWHFHLAMPGSDEDSSEHASPPVPDFAEAGTAAAWTSLLRGLGDCAMWVPATSITAPLGGSAMVPDRSHPSAHGFFATFATDMPLPLRPGVMHC